ncbi:MAG: hypothetical protein WD990_02290 [Acidimicrobiia bacterium]
MARRSRDRRKSIPGYDDLRPRRDDRARDHRKVRHAAHQMLRTATDVDALAPLPEVRPDHHHEREASDPLEGPPSQFKVGKTKFWKRRDQYKEERARRDARWSELGASEG